MEEYTAEAEQFRRGLGQYTLREAANKLGLSTRTILRYLSGKHRIPVIVFLAIESINKADDHLTNVEDDDLI